MKFSKITAISISPQTKPIFESLEKIKPANMSFSLFLAVAIDDYVKNYTKVTNSKYPRVMDRMDLWNDCLKDLSNDDLVKINNRVSQLTNKLRKELQSRV